MDSLNQFLIGMGLLELSFGQVVMIGISFVLIYLAIVKKYEPLLLLPLAFGMFIANIPVWGFRSMTKAD